MSAARILFASDVFGITDAFSRLAEDVCSDPVLVSAHADTGLAFASEAEAYERFVRDGGVDAYARRVGAVLAADNGIAALIGFSAGASACWVACATEAARRLRGGVLFYGSRIRDYAGLRPVCPVRLVFAERETSFAPEALVRALVQRGVDAELVPDSGHGFMNELSASHCAALRHRFVVELRDFAARCGA